MGFENVGKVWDEVSFAEFVKTQDLSWAKGITIHHTANPHHGNRPRGLTIQHIRNIQSGYERKRPNPWRSGPHLFTDEDQIFGMSSLERRGIHAKSFNGTHIGIEVLGNYDTVDPLTDERGNRCWATAVATTAILIQSAPTLTVSGINGHRDDPRTDKTCPGKKWDMDKFRAKVTAYLSAEGRDREDDPAEAKVIDVEGIHKAIAAIEWQLSKLKNAL